MMKPMIAIVLLSAAWTAAGQFAFDEFRLTKSGEAVFRARGDLAVPAMVESSADLSAWESVAEIGPGPLDMIIVGSALGSEKRRFYRIRSVMEEVVALELLPNGVFPPPEGFDTIQFAPDGGLGFITWIGESLVYRTQHEAGHWEEEVICRCGGLFEPKAYDEHRFQPMAALFYDRLGRAHVIRTGGQSGRLIRHVRQAEEWVEWEEMKVPGVDKVELFAAAMDSEDGLHVAVVESGERPGLYYGKEAEGWKWHEITRLPGLGRGFYRQSYAPRYFSLAVDEQKRAHLSFVPEFETLWGDRGALIRSELFYASNDSGEWRTELVIGPQDGSADAGLGASLAIGPQGRPVIAAFYNERLATGSSRFSQLIYLQKDGNGAWYHETAARYPADNYVAGDGTKGAGFAPYLRFAPSGEPHIIFSDHASQHFESGQNEYAGQIRHVHFDGVDWVERTLYGQGSPLEEQMIYPAFAIGDGEIALLGLGRWTSWLEDDRTAESLYRMIFLREEL